MAEISVAAILRGSDFQMVASGHLDMCIDLRLKTAQLAEAMAAAQEAAAELAAARERLRTWTQALRAAPALLELRRIAEAN